MATEDLVEVHLTTEIFLPELPGGLRQFHRYAPGLKERGVQLVIHVKRREHDTADEFEDNAVRVVTHRLPDGISHHTEREHLLRAAVTDIGNRKGVGKRFCLQPNGCSWKSTALLWRQRITGLPSLFYSTMFPIDPPEGFYRNLKYRLRLKAIHTPFSYLLVCSQRIAVAYQKTAGLKKSKTVVFPNGVDLEKFSPPDALEKKNLRRSLNLPPEAKIVLYSGSITPRKGVNHLLDAWVRLANAGDLDGAVLIIAGSFGMRPTFRDEGMRKELESFTTDFERSLAEFPMPGALVMPGDVDNIADYYRAADIFAFPSKREGLPNSVLEAMACGLPSVISEFAGIPDPGEEFGDPGTHHLRVSHDDGEIALALSELLSDDAKASSMGAKARAHIEATQRFDSTLDQVAGLYRSVAK